MNVLHKKINSDFSDSLNVHSFSYIMFVMSTIKYPNAISTGSLTLAHSQNSQMSFMYGFFFVKFLFFTVVCVVIVV